RDHIAPIVRVTPNSRQTGRPTYALADRVAHNLLEIILRNPMLRKVLDNVVGPEEIVVGHRNPLRNVGQPILSSRIAGPPMSKTPCCAWISPRMRSMSAAARRVVSGSRMPRAARSAAAWISAINSGGMPVGRIAMLIPGL